MLNGSASTPTFAPLHHEEPPWITNGSALLLIVLHPCYDPIDCTSSLICWRSLHTIAPPRSSTHHQWPLIERPSVASMTRARPLHGEASLDQQWLPLHHDGAGRIIDGPAESRCGAGFSGAAMVLRWICLYSHR